TVGFMVTFVVGGMTGVLLAVPPADFVLHNSLFLIAHFHNVIIGGVVSGLFAGMTIWFPKAFGFRLNDYWGKMAFWFWLSGYWFAFPPTYVPVRTGVPRPVRAGPDGRDPPRQPLHRSVAASLVPDRRLRCGADRHRHRLLPDLYLRQLPQPRSAA